MRVGIPGVEDGAGLVDRERGRNPHAIRAGRGRFVVLHESTCRPSRSDGNVAVMATARWKDLCVDATARDPRPVAAFWADALDLEAKERDDGDWVLRGVRP